MEDISHRIHDAAKKGSIDDVAKLLREYPDLVNDKGEDGWTPMFRACYNNRLDLAKFLAESGANLGRDADDFQNTPLHACCINGHKKVAEYLLTKGVDVNEYDNVGSWTPLYAAAFFGWPDLVRLLLSHGADPSIRCKEGKTAVEVVCEAGYRGEHKQTIEGLLRDKSEHPPPGRVNRGRGTPGSRRSSGLAAGNTGSSLTSPSTSTSSSGLSGPPPYVEDRTGTRIYFPWELTYGDYFQRSLEFIQEILTKLFKDAYEAGKIKELPTSKNRFKFVPDAYDLVEVGLDHEKALQAHIEASAVAGKVETADNEEPPPVACPLHTSASSSGLTGTLKERLQAIGAAIYKPSLTRDEIDALMVHVLALAELVHYQDDIDDVKYLLDQFHTHADSKSLRLQFLRVSQIRHTLEGHERVSNHHHHHHHHGSSSFSSTDGSLSRNGNVGVSGGFSSLGIGGDGEGNGEDANCKKDTSFVEQFKFVQDHTGDLVLTDDVK